MIGRREAGSILVLALLVCAAAAIAGIWMVISSDLNVRRNRYLARSADASRVGASGVQIARKHLGANQAWAGGTFADPGYPTDSVTVAAAASGVLMATVSAVGAAGDATQTVAAALHAVPHPAVETCVFSNSTIVFDDAVTGGLLFANGAVTATGDVDFAGTLKTVRNNPVTNQIDPDQIVYVDLPLPAPTPNLMLFASAASPLVGLPDDSNDRLYLQRTSLTPTYNPYGGQNVYGAYKIDGGGEDVLLRDVYILGTLLVYNAPKVIIERGYWHSRAHVFLPTLIVVGDLEMRLEAALTEPTMLKDFNRDGDMNDVHPPGVAGVVYVTGAFTGPYGGTVQGSIIAQSVTIAGVSTLRLEPLQSTTPVIEFTVPGPWDVLAGSIQG